MPAFVPAVKKPVRRTKGRREKEKALILYLS